MTIALDPGGRISGTCLGITGNPQPIVSLTKISGNNSVSTVDLLEYHFHGNCLWMETTGKDVGHYQVLAENCFGRTSVSVSLIATGKKVEGILLSEFRDCMVVVNL